MAESPAKPAVSLVGDDRLPSVAWPMAAFLRLAMLLGGIGGVLAVALFFVVPRVYTSTSIVSAAADSRKNMGGALASLSGAFGLSSTEGAASPQYIATLLTSRNVLESVVRSHAGAAATSPTVAGLVLGRPASTSFTPVEIAQAREQLGGSVSTSVDARTGLVGIAVTMRDPALAARVNAEIIAAADSVIQSAARDQARRRREFVGRRLDVARTQLAEAEAAQVSFWESNKVRTSPTLSLEERRLDRMISSRQELYTSLAHDYEQSLQEEVRDLPSVNVFTTPDVPWRKSAPLGSHYLIAGVAAGIFVATILALLASLEGERGGSQPRTARALLAHALVRSRRTARG